MSSQDLWVQHQTFIDLVLIGEYTYIDQFLNALYNRPLLAIPKDSAFTLYRPDGKTEIKPTDTLQSLEGAGMKGDAPLIVKAVVTQPVENTSRTDATDIILAIRELTLEIRESNRFLRKKVKNDFTLTSYKSDNVRLQWLLHYGMVHDTATKLPERAYCHMLGAQVPLKYLTCSHIFLKRWHRHVRDFGLSSINSEKNIVIMLKIFEEAFEAGRFVLLFDKQTSLIRCKIIDNALRHKKHDDAMRNMFDNYQIGDVDFQKKIYFGDFDGQGLSFLNSERPSTRCLSFHALVVREHALDYGWIDENELKELDDDDMWSDGFLDERTRKFIDKWRVDVSSQFSAD